MLYNVLQETPYNTTQEKTQYSVWRIKWKQSLIKPWVGFKFLLAVNQIMIFHRASVYNILD